ncbi:PREDICTED: aluminum-activated malate transporter 9-like [Camelina sativa]|uniref:Aluminum-activated malate transporter 9-like n=1 Tax=Camelina sativa TaxID=90675 RepID=A0ABM1RU52_CAMSA|nr:PREDICTED: aluminum-activated malate transporter 9-like [Camelina sativa]
MAAKQGSFRHAILEKRERLLSNNGFSDFRFTDIESNDLLEGGNNNNNGRTTRLCCCCSCGNLSERISGVFESVKDVAKKAWDMGVSDPRKIVFSAKIGLALMIVALLIFFQEPNPDLSRYSVWAILTVVVVFEFTIGATLSKGFNRALGTLSAGGLALGMAELSTLCGDWEELFCTLSIFCIGFLATFMKLYPAMKAYEYGFRVFLLTYCYILISGFRTGEFIQVAISRFLLIALGAGVSLGVNMFIYPIWAGEDLHNLVVKNFLNVATSLEGCVNGYLRCVEYERIPSKILTYQASEDPVYKGYRSAVESTSQEESLMSFAIWEPPHGPYKSFNYPWKNYVKLSGALKHCAFTVMALHGCILSEIQAPEERRQVFRQELQRVGVEGAKLLRELGEKVKKMEKIGPDDLLFEVHLAAEELQHKIDKKSYLLVNSECWEIGNRATKESQEPQEHLSLEDSENQATPIYAFKSLSEAVLEIPTSWGEKNHREPLNHRPTLSKQVSWPARLVLPPHLKTTNGTSPLVETTKTYESASALSLATFASLLIEFVARLENVVDAFEELSRTANFKEPEIVTSTTDLEFSGERVGLVPKIRRCFGM